MSQCFLMRHGMYFRPDAKGYTSSVIEAGLYSLADGRDWVEKVDGVSMKTVDQMLKEIDAERENMKAKLALLDKHERHALGLRVDD